MDWERQLEQIEREVKAKALQDPDFADLVKSDFGEAVKQATGFELPFHLLHGLQAAGTVSGELTDEQLLEVAGGVQGISQIGVTVSGSISQDAQTKDKEASQSGYESTTGGGDAWTTQQQEITNIISNITNILQQMQQSEMQSLKKRV